MHEIIERMNEIIKARIFETYLTSEGESLYAVTVIKTMCLYVLQ